MSLKTAIYFILSTILFSSCNYEKKLHETLYFNDAADSTSRVVARYNATIQVDDRLSIVVSSLDPEAAMPYNAATTAGYLVEKDGTILLPQLGKLNVEGKTLKKVRDTLLIALSKYLTDPVVFVQFANTKILVLGEVGHPGLLSIVDGKLTILEAITLSGDVPITGRKDNILIVREDNGERTFGRLNIQSHDIYKSPYYFLKQNDLVYVEPNKLKVKQQSEQTFIRNIGLFTTTISVLTSVIFLLTYLRR
ncbi:polysaccharide biosynthesis/export family protein [Parasediminibacterium sp. JCM 36343]|uniref:polysaccharide biosynthesis/export family protein n=1 Tax=Parasediminibacterium sp. JCM 36343 TaxID=3374279 RepID=UPI003979B4C3